MHATACVAEKLDRNIEIYSSTKGPDDGGGCWMSRCATENDPLKSIAQAGDYAGKLPNSRDRLPRFFERNRNSLQRLAIAVQAPKMPIIFESFRYFWLALTKIGVQEVAGSNPVATI